MSPLYKNPYTPHRCNLPKIYLMPLKNLGYNYSIGDVFICDECGRIWEVRNNGGVNWQRCSFTTWLNFRKESKRIKQNRRNKDA